ncbi:MAG: M24 family metallopeptidase [Pseudomonadota bacterium]
MTLHFPREEFDARVAAARRKLGEVGLDALLVFAQESHYYLTGFDSGGYKHFQCAVLTADQRPITLFTRRPDQEQARATSTIADIRIWYDAEGANPALALRDILAEKGLEGARLGVEMATHGLTAANWERLRLALDGWCRLEDATTLVHFLRVVKSPAELVYVRRAAALADDTLAAMLASARPGAFEGDILAAIQATILKGGGDVPNGAMVLGSGERAHLVRGTTGRRHLSPVDQLTMEWSASYRRYQVGIMRTVDIGAPNPRHERMFEATRDALAAMTEAARPGEPVGRIDEAHRRVFDAAGYAEQRLAACGYSVGATYPPRFMDYPPLLYAGNPMPARPGMVLFLHAILADPRAGAAMSLGHTVVITETGREVLSKLEPKYEVLR